MSLWRHILFRPASNVRGNFTLVLAADKRLLDDIKITMDYSTLPNIPLDGNRVVISGAGKHFFAIKYVTVNPVCNDHLYYNIYYLWFIQ